MTTDWPIIRLFKGHKEKVVFPNWEFNDTYFERQFDIIQKYFNVNGVPYDIKLEDVDHALIITKTALAKFDTLSPLNKTNLLNFATNISYIETYFILMKDKAERIRKLGEYYMESQLIPDAIAEVSIFLTPARSLRDMTQDKATNLSKICIFAVNYFENFNTKTQKDLEEIYYLFNHMKRDIITSNPVFISLKKIFDVLAKHIDQGEFRSVEIDIEPEPILSSSPFDRGIAKIRNSLKNKFQKTKPLFHENEFHVTQCELTESQNAHFKRDEALDKKYIDEQIVKIENFLTRLVQHYYIPMIYSPEKSVDSADFMEEFQQLLPLTARYFFVQQPGGPTHLQKKLIINILCSLTMFVEDFFACFNSNKTIHPFIGERLNKGTYDKLALEKDIKNKINQITKFCLHHQHLDSYPSKMMRLLLTHPIKNKIIDFVLQPDVIVFIINRFLKESPWKITKPPTKPCACSHPTETDQFSFELGRSIVDLAAKFFKFGEPTGIANLIGTEIIRYLEDNVVNVGMFTKKYIMAITSSECFIEPIRILDLILFSAETTPTFPQFFSQTPEQRTLARQELRQNIEVNYIPSLKQWIKSRSFIARLLLKCDSIEEYCKTIQERLFLLINNDDLLQALAFYLLCGVKQSLASETERIDEERHSAK